MRRLILAPLVALITLPFLSSGASAQTAPQCATVQGRTVCGYQCVVAYGQARCTQTPEGVCASAYGKVTCWDPPPYVRRHYGGNVPLPNCLADDGDLDCGYGCISAYGHVTCAQTPVGACDSDSGRIACGDPRPEEFRRERGTLRAMQCLHESNRVGCGYGCAYWHGEVRCSVGPEGSCSVIADQLVCFEPAPPPPP